MNLSPSLSEPRLVKSKILSSLKPKIGRKFNYEDLENKKEEKLIALRKEILSIAIEFIPQSSFTWYAWYLRCAVTSARCVLGVSPVFRLVDAWIKIMHSV